MVRGCVRCRADADQHGGISILHGGIMNCSRVDHGSSVTLKIRGELDALSAPELRPVLDQVVEDQVRHVIVDLSELRLIDSSGVGALVSLYKRVRSYGGELGFSGV